MRRALFGSVLFVCLAGCSGGGGSSTIVPAAKATASGPLVPVAFSFRVGRTSATSRRSSSIDPATLSVSIVVNGLAPQVVNVTPGCNPCSATINAPVGTDTFTAIAYSGIGSGGVALDSSLGQVSQTIALNAVNSVTLTLSPVVSTTADTGLGSLRNAVANASAGDTITFLPSAQPSITLSSTIALAKNVIISGPGVGIETISGGGTAQIFTVAGGVTATIQNLTLTNGASATNGGAISNAGSLTLNSVDVNSSQAATGGGGVSSIGSALRITNSTFSLNNAVNGGALYVSGGATSVTGTTFTSNGAQNNGGAIDDVNVGDTFDSDTFATNIAGNSTNVGLGGGMFLAGGTISNSTFTANTVVATPGYVVEGGAVAASVALTLISDNMSNNVATNGTGSALGGAVFSIGPLTVTGGTYSANHAQTGSGTASGGAIHVNGFLTVTNATFTSNTALGYSSASGRGGAIDAAGGAGTISGSTFSSNAVTGAATSTGFGGALASILAFTISGCTFSGDTATTSGGGYFATGTVTDSIAQSSFTNESITGTGSNQIQGGGIYNDTGTTMNLTQVTFSGNQLMGSTSADGAGMFNGGNATITNSTFFNNQSSYNAGGFSSGTGGGSGAVRLSTFYGNSATSLGGNMLVEGSSNIATFGSVYVNAGGPSNIGHNGTITSSGYNWVDTTEVGFSGTGDRNNAGSPNLSGTLAANASLLTPIVQTMAPNALSGLIAQIPIATCTGVSAVDERAVARGHGNPSFCTIGAYEYP